MLFMRMFSEYNSANLLYKLAIISAADIGSELYVIIYDIVDDNPKY